MKYGLSGSIAAAMVLAMTGLIMFGAGGAMAVRWGEGYFPNHSVVTHKGEKIKFYDDAIRGKIVVFNFIYTSCPDICSLSTARLAQVRERLGDRVGRDIFFYSVSLDPETDTPEVLKEFADAFQSGDGWLFLTGDPKKLHQIRYKLGERSRTLDEHRSDLVLGNDRTGEWQRMSLMSNLNIVAQKILEMDPEYRAKKREVAVRSDTELARTHRISGDQPGQALFLKACSSCHTVGQGDLVGPDLRGMTERRELSWLIRYLKNPDVLRAKKDPVALALDAKYKGVSMPNLGLSDSDSEDLIAYVRAQEALLVRSEAAGEAETGHHQHGHHGHGKDNHEHHGHHGHEDNKGDHGGHDHGHHDHQGHGDDH
jgi:protein SCO1